MSQHDFDIANQTASASRADLNLGLKALASLSSGATAPATTYANMLWYDTSTTILKQRSEADDAWIDLGTFNQGTNTFSANVDLPTLATSVWETGTSTDEAVISPAKLAAGIAALAAGPSTTYDAVGTYALLTSTTAAQRPPGTVVSGSVLYPANTLAGPDSSAYSGSGRPTGSWRVMGQTGYFNNTVEQSGNNLRTTLYVRIS
jgi:hypothetical protein